MKSWLVLIVSFLQWTCCTSQNVCEEPPDLDFGEIISDEKAEYLESDRVQYKCNSGYVLEGFEWIICKGQKWTSLPKCLAPCVIAKEQLEAKNLLMSGGRRHSQMIQSSQTLEFLCREGYALTSPSVRRCVDGHMDLPLCISERGKNCSRPPTIHNGDIMTIFRNQYTSGSSVEFKCQRYYAMEGHNSSFCDNGTWTKVPACLEPCAISLAEMEGHNIEVKGRSDESGSQNMYLQRGNSVELTCKPGYTLAENPPQSAFAIQCDGKPTVYPECKDVICLPPQVQHGMFQPKENQYRYEDTIQMQCDHGYQGSGKISKCTENGWIPPPECMVGCEYPNIENGELVTPYEEMRRNNFPVSRLYPVHFRCNRGFLTSNRFEMMQVHCTRSGWNPEPKCFKICDLQDNVQLPRVWPRRLYRGTIYIEGEEISYECERGFSPSNPQARARCTRDGWSPNPLCAPEDGTCRQLPTIANADIVEGTASIYQPGHRVHYQCHEGYKMLGSDSITCRNRKWSRPPRCEDNAGKCDRPPLIENGDIEQFPKSEYIPGDWVKYRCQSLYRMEGSAIVQCHNGRWSDVPRCIDPCIATEEAMRLNNIRLKWVNEEKLYSESGHAIEFVCLRGYRSDPTSQVPFRAQCRDGRLEYPRCIR